MKSTRSRPARARWCALWLALALPALAQSAPAADVVKKAKEAYLTGLGLYKEGHYREAASYFEQANFLSPRAGNWLNIARCYDQVNETPKSLAAYRAYLREAPSAPERAEVEASIVKLQNVLKASGVQQLTVLSTPADAKATVSIDGRMVGVTPLTLELPKGSHTVALEANGYLAAERKVDTTLEKAVDLTVEFKPAPPAQPRSDVPLAGDPKGTSVTPPGNGEPPPPPPPLVVEGTRKPYLFAWVGTGLTVAAAAAGIILYVLALGVKSNLAAGENGAPRTSAQNNDLIRTGTGLETGGFIGFGATGALAITTALLFAFEGK